MAARLSDELDRFRSIRHLTNHWEKGRRRRNGRVFYWFLTFDGAQALRDLVTRCQQEMTLPYYDHVSDDGLHLTLDRIAFEDQIGVERLRVVEEAGRTCAKNVTPFNISIGALGGTPGAVGFNVFPRRPVLLLREALRAATLSAYPHAPIKGGIEFTPHVTIAYCNASEPSSRAITTVERLHSLPAVDVAIRDVSLVLLDTGEQEYIWTSVARIPLTG